MDPRQQLIATVDGRSAVLYACKRLPHGGLRLDEVSRIENGHEREHDRGRPTQAGGAERAGSVLRSGAHAAPHTISVARTANEESHRFAREVASWLERERTRHGTGRLALFAPARSLGLLREQLAGWSSPPESFEGELIHLRPNELAEHPAVLNAMRNQPV